MFRKHCSLKEMCFFRIILFFVLYFIYFYLIFISTVALKDRQRVILFKSVLNILDMYIHSRKVRTAGVGRFTVMYIQNWTAVSRED